MNYRFSQRSRENLAEVHPDLVIVMTTALLTSPIDFAVIEGIRTERRQRELVQSGASQTMRSRHLTGHAVDVAAISGGVIRWDWPLYERLSHHIKDAARHHNIPIEWGGDWASLRDGPHWQLPWEHYPT